MMENLQRESWYIGNLVGVPIFLHWTALFLVMLVVAGGWNAGPDWIILHLVWLIAGIVLHELGHGLMAKALGAFGITITLWAFGGLCSSRRDSARVGRELAIVAAGPAVSLALCAGCWALLEWLRLNQPGLLSSATGPSLLRDALAVGFAVNLSLFIFNMLPIFPMDGGQLVFYSMIGVTRNQRLSRQVCLFLAVFGALAFFMWRTGLFAVGGDVGLWVQGLQLWDLFLAFVLFLMVRSAVQILG
jgi:Zn-dependent protease